MKSAQAVNTPLDPSPILQTAFAFWSSKVLLTAVALDVFTKLGARRATSIELSEELGIQPRGARDFFDALVAMKFLDRDGDGASALYLNTPAGTLYLDRNSPRYIGGILIMLNERLFKFWHDLPEALRTGHAAKRSEARSEKHFRGTLPGPAKARTIHGRDDRIIPD